MKNRIQGYQNIQFKNFELRVFGCTLHSSASITIIYQLIKKKELTPFYIFEQGILRSWPIVDMF